MATDPPADLPLASLGAEPQPIRHWLTTFHLVAAVLDPFTYESAWMLPTVARIFRVYDDADCRVALIVTCTDEEARQFLGPYAGEFLVFTDPERLAAKGFGLERLPALVHVRQDGTLAGAAEGWDPDRWRDLTHRLSEAMCWTKPLIPARRDPAAFDGTPALG